MRFRLWGTRGSIPSPLRAEEIEAKIQAVLFAAAEAGIDLSDPSAIRAFIASLPYAIRGTAGGDTSCLEVRSAGNLLIFDCGSGIRRLGLELMKEEFGRGRGVAHIFICHTHWDHMMGWPYFNPSYVPGNKFYIYGVHPDLEERFRHQQKAPSMFPISLDFHRADIHFVTLQEGGTIQIGQTSVSNMCFHHPGDSYGYRVEDEDGVFIYAGDSEYKTLDPAATRHVVEFFRGADALVFDAMFSLHDSYYFEDWGHSSAVAGADLATRAGVRRLLLFHHAPPSTDEEIWNLRDEAEEYLKKQHPDRPPCEILVAHDGFEMELWREARLETRMGRLSEGVAVHLTGRLAAETTPIALAAIDEAATLAGDQPLAIDLSEAAQVDREGVKALLLARRRWCPLALSGLSSELRRTFTKAGALDHFAVFDTPQDALVAMKREQDLRPGQLLDGRYKIDQRIGEGPLGPFYRATDRTTRRYVTIQVICPGIGPSPAQTLMEAAQTAAVLQYPLIARVFGAGQDDHVRYIATGYTSGRSVRQLIDADDTATSLPPAQAVHIGLQVAQALEYAHGQKVVHGALRPENIILTEDNAVQVTHFGVGRLEIDKPLSELPAHVSPLDYLAPEQIQGHGNSPASDLYALGTILYEMLTGQLPFAAMASEEDLISFQLLQPPVPPRRRNPGLSRALEHLVLKLLQKSPLDRPSTAGVVRQILAGLDPQRFQGTLLGRDVICQKLRTHLERVAHGQSGLLVVHGQRGIGKSHLVLSVADQRVTDQPLLALHGELFSYENARPYQVFVRALRHALLALPAHRLSQLLDDLGKLSRPLTALIPELKPALSAFTPSHVEYESLEEAVCRTLRFMATKDPVMLILDSLQWIDVASLQLLERLVRHQIPRLLIVVLYRTEALDREHPLRQALDALESWIVDRIHVTPLGPVNVHQMTSTLGDTHNIPPDFSLWLSAETGGNPLHIEQLVRAYLEGPRETRHPHERATAVTLEDVILRRLERLSDSALTTLRQAAVLGHTFHFSTLHLALDQPERQVLADLSSALRDRFILGHPAEDHYSFSAPLIREVIYTEMLGGVRKRYHQRAARVLEKGGLSGVMDEKIDLLAHHFLHAGEHEKAVTYLARATRRARELCAYDSALNYINRALAVVEHLIQTAANEREREYRLRQRGDLWAARADLETTIAQGASQEG